MREHPLAISMSAQSLLRKLYQYIKIARSAFASKSKEFWGAATKGNMFENLQRPLRGLLSIAHFWGVQFTLVITV